VKLLRGGADRRRGDFVFGLAALGREALAVMAPAALLVLDADAVDLPAGPLLHGAGLPVLDVAGDVDALDLGVGGAAPPRVFCSRS